MSNAFDLIELIKLAIANKKLLCIVAIIAIILSALVSLLLPNYYTSEITFYASNPNLTNRSSLFQKEITEATNTFGDKTDADRLISIGKSGQIIGYCVSTFKLYKHYKIDSTAKYAQFKMKEKFNKNFSIQKNELGAVVVKVSDINPNLAAEMANEIVKKIDEINSGMIAMNKEEIVKVFENEKKEKAKLVQLFTDSVKHNAQLIDTVQKNILKQLLRNAVNNYNEVSNLYDQYVASASKNLSSVYIVEKAFPTDRKSRPQRSLIVLASLILAVGSCFLTLILHQRFKDINLH